MWVCTLCAETLSTHRDRKQRKVNGECYELNSIVVVLVYTSLFTSAYSLPHCRACVTTVTVACGDGRVDAHLVDSKFTGREQIMS